MGSFVFGHLQQTLPTSRHVKSKCQLDSDRVKLVLGQRIYRRVQEARQGQQVERLNNFFGLEPFGIETADFPRDPQYHKKWLFAWIFARSKKLSTSCRGVNCNDQRLDGAVRGFGVGRSKQRRTAAARWSLRSPAPQSTGLSFVLIYKYIFMYIYIYVYVYMYMYMYILFSVWQKAQTYLFKRWAWSKRRLGSGEKKAELQAMGQKTLAWHGSNACETRLRHGDSLSLTCCA